MVAIEAVVLFMMFSNEVDLGFSRLPLLNAVHDIGE